MIRIISVQTPDQIKLFFRFASSNSGRAEEQLLKNFLNGKSSVSSLTQEKKSKLWLTFEDKKCSGRIATHVASHGIGYITCFSATGAKENVSSNTPSLGLPR